MKNNILIIVLILAIKLTSGLNERILKNCFIDEDRFYEWTGEEWNITLLKDYNIDSLGIVTGLINTYYNNESQVQRIYIRTDYGDYYTLSNKLYGDPETETIYTYDLENNLLKHEYEYIGFYHGEIITYYGNFTNYYYSDNYLTSFAYCEWELFKKGETSRERVIYSYDENGRITSELKYDILADSLLTEKTFWQYEAGIATGISEVLSDSNWLNSTKKVRTLNESNNPITEERFIWINNTWLNDEKDEILYDELGNSCQKITLKYDSILLDYEPYKKNVTAWYDSLKQCTVNGYVVLEGQSDNSGIQVNFQSIYPDSLFSYSVYSDQTGYYSCLVEDGYYNISFEKIGYNPVLLSNEVLYTDRNISDQAITLYTGLENQDQYIKEFILYQNYPNPFNPTTTINYTLAASGLVELNIYNLKGELIAVLQNGFKKKGTYTYDLRGENMTSGIYIYNLKVNGQMIQSRKMMLVK